MAARDHKPKDRQRTFFFRFLVSYILVLAIPVITGAVLYQESQRFVFREVRSATESVISQAAGVVDRSLADLKTIVDQFSIDDEFSSISLTEPPLSGRFYYRMQGVVDTITAQVLTRQLLSRYFLYLPYSDYVLAQNTAYQASFFFAHAFRYPDMEYADWVHYSEEPFSNAVILPGRWMIFQGNDLHGIPVVWRFPIPFPAERHGFVVFVLDQKQFVSILSRLQQTPGSSTYVSNDSGDIVVAVGGNEEEFGLVRERPEERFVGEGSSRKLVTSIRSGYSDLSYIVLTPAKYLDDRIAYIRRITLAALLVAVCLGAMIAFYFAMRNSRPLRTILRSVTTDALADTSDERNPFDVLQSGVARLITAKSRVDEQLSRQTAYLMESSLRRIIKGQFRSGDEITRAVEYLSIDLRAEYYLVFSVRLFRGDRTSNRFAVDESLLGRLVLEQVLEVRDDLCRIYAVEVDEGELALITCWLRPASGDERSQAERKIDRIATHLRSEYGITLEWGGGNVVTSLQRICVSYERARWARNHGRFDGTKDGCWYDETDWVRVGIEYPLELESRIVFLLQAGDNDEIVRLIHENFAANETELSDSVRFERYVQYIKNTFSRAELRLEEWAELERTMQEVSVDDSASGTLESMLDVFESACAAVNARKKSHNSQLKDAILAYLDEHYGDINLSLFSVASSFGLSAGYLSHFFKEQTGANFSTHLESVRMANAQTLLADETVQIQEVARTVGYANAYSFRRVFRKVTGSSPSEYRLQASMRR